MLSFETMTHSLKLQLAFICLALLPASPAVAQLIRNDKLHVTLEAALPSGRANPAYRQYLNGLITFQPKLQYKFAESWYVAGGARYSYATVSEFKVPVKTRGGEHVVGGFLEAGWCSWQSERFGLEFGIKGGLAQHYFITDLTRETGIEKLTALYIQPTFSFILASDEAVAYRWIVGYCIDGYDFKPFHLGMETNGGFTSDDLNKPSQALLVGFAFSWYFGNERSE